MTHGIRMGEIVTITAGTGVGKSQFCREIAHGLVKAGHTLGYIALEESTARTALGLMSIEVNQRLHLGADKAMLKDAFDRTFSDNRVYLYDHFGSTEEQNLLDRVRYMVKGLGCRVIVLDHISIAVSAIEGDERKMLDALMTKLRTLVEEVKCAMFLVCHLKRVDGRPHEEGGEVRLSHLRSSAGIAQLSDCVIALERNQQSSERKNQTRVRVLKNRFTGETGVAMALEYDQNTGRMSPCEMFDPVTDGDNAADF
jgi:twinkle protein